ncbi:MAG: DNA-binding protein [Tenericutes bacterium HGW-Tenericutes-2]|jgi:excisionase family DNA binding protein|nr:MAG: DNA-binding protein [Tenericutes bacterium HGW-Tenericutes-2]
METNNGKKNENVYNINELQEILQVKRPTLLKYIKTKKIKAFKVGNQWRVTQEHLDEFILRNMK